MVRVRVKNSVFTKALNCVSTTEIIYEISNQMESNEFRVVKLNIFYERHKLADSLVWEFDSIFSVLES